MEIYVGYTNTVKLDISEEEHAKIPLRGRRGNAWITDKKGKRYHVRTASCGLPHCLCALEFVKDKK